VGPRTIRFDPGTDCGTLHAHCDRFVNLSSMCVIYELSVVGLWICPRYGGENEGKENRNDLHLFLKKSSSQWLYWQHSLSTEHSSPMGVHCFRFMIDSKREEG
jgi:hypothetical protein